MDLYVGQIAVAPVIVALIEALKKYAGMDVKWAPLVNLSLTALAYVGIGMLGMHPDALQPTVVILNVVVGFLTVAGLYDGVKRYDTIKRIQ
jgi:hypothetical protein